MSKQYTGGSMHSEPSKRILNDQNTVSPRKTTASPAGGVEYTGKR